MAISFFSLLKCLRRGNVCRRSVLFLPADRPAHSACVGCSPVSCVEQGLGHVWPRIMAGDGVTGPWPHPYPGRARFGSHGKWNTRQQMITDWYGLKAGRFCIASEGQDFISPKRATDACFLPCRAFGSASLASCECPMHVKIGASWLSEKGACLATPVYGL